MGHYNRADPHTVEKVCERCNEDFSFQTRVDAVGGPRSYEYCEPCREKIRENAEIDIEVDPRLDLDAHSLTIDVEYGTQAELPITVDIDTVERVEERGYKEPGWVGVFGWVGVQNEDGEFLFETPLTRKKKMYSGEIKLDTRYPTRTIHWNYRDNTVSVESGTAYGRFEVEDNLTSIDGKPDEASRLNVSAVFESCSDAYDNASDETTIDVPAYKIPL